MDTEVKDLQRVEIVKSSVSAQDFINSLYEVNKDGIYIKKESKPFLYLGGVWSATDQNPSLSRYHKIISRIENPLNVLMDGLLLYEKIYIPTNDFLIVPILVNQFGAKAVIEMFESELIEFIRVKGSLYYSPAAFWGAYADNISSAEPEEALLALQETFEQKLDPAIQNSIGSIIQTVKVDEVQDIIAKEVHDDLIQSSYFQTKYSDSDVFNSVENGDIALLSESSLEDEVPFIRDISALINNNIELILAEKFQCRDLSSLLNENKFTDIKVKRAYRNEPEVKTAMEFFEMHSIPDIAFAVNHDKELILKLLKLRNNSDGQAFRDWYWETSTNVISTRPKAQEIERAYNDIINQLSLPQPYPIRALRYAFSTLPVIPAVIDGVGFVTDSITSGVDAMFGTNTKYFVNGLFRSSSPKYFIDQLRQTTNQN